MSTDNQIERLKNHDQEPHFARSPEEQTPPIPINEADPVDEAEWESFPASDPPSYSAGTSSPSQGDDPPVHG